YADYDMMAGWAISAKYQNKPEDFFGGASSSWRGSDQIKGAAVKLREMWRRTPQHYRWENKGGGRWILKKLSFPIFAEIDTGSRDWEKTVDKISRRLIV
ncbi:MAG: hypothetical protein Q8N68_00945, partial [bacterium]|nr:hypothetical protein [bacterium]